MTEENKRGWDDLAETYFANYHTDKPLAGRPLLNDLIKNEVGDVEGNTLMHLLLSSPGGSVFHGLSVYNFLKGAPFEVYTYNFGSVDIIEKDMHDRKTLSPAEAMDYGLVGEIKSEFFLLNAEFISIGEPIGK